MGRYYSGDIEGKFWFAVQDSTDASFFGVEPSEPNVVEYYFEEDDLPSVEDGLRKCKEALGEFKQKIDKFFQERDAYNEKELAKYLGIDKEKTHTLLQWYARLELGNKIYNCIKEKGDCCFDAELC